MKQYLKDFCKIGLMACGGGPLILAIVYGILGARGAIAAVSVREVVLGVITSLLLAFIAGGVSVVYQMEKLPLLWASFLHALVLYLDYILIYLLNGWLPFEVKPLLLFTMIFLAGYGVIWCIVYLVIRRNIQRMNAQMQA